MDVLGAVTVGGINVCRRKSRPGMDAPPWRLIPEKQKTMTVLCLVEFSGLAVSRILAVVTAAAQGDVWLLALIFGELCKKLIKIHYDHRLIVSCCYLMLPKMPSIPVLPVSELICAVSHDYRLFESI